MVSYLKAELKKFLTNPKTLLVLVLLPLLFTFIMGGVYVKTYLYDIPLVVLDSDNSSLSRTIVGEFASNPYFKVIGYVQSYRELEELVQAREAYAGLVMPEDFAKDVKEGKAPKSLFIVDGTNLVIGNSALARGAEILNTFTAGTQLKVLQSQGMVPVMAEKTVQSFSFLDRILYDPRLSYIGYLFVGILGIFVQQTYLAVMVPELVTEKEELAGQGGLTKIAVKSFVKGVLSFVTFAVCLFLASSVFNLPVRGELGYVLVLVAIFIFNLTVPALLISAFTRDVLKGSQICMFLSVPTLLTAGYVWPEYMMPEPLIIGVKLFWPLIYYAGPARDVLVKGVPFHVIWPYVWQGLLYGIIWIPLAVAVYKKRLQVSQE